MVSVPPLDTSNLAAIQHRIDLKTKPPGALGRLEPLAAQLVAILTQGFDGDIIDARPTVSDPQMIVFAGDHGIAQHGVSIAPSEVTRQMVDNFAAGGAAINVFCRQLGWGLTVVDTGMLSEPTATDAILSHRLGDTTKPFNTSEAMTEDQLQQGLAAGRELISTMVDSGCNVFAFGEMGIGNTTSAAAIFSALSGLPPSETVGRGTGVDDEIVAKKQALIEEALTLHGSKLDDPLGVLRCLGGFEIVQMVGAILGAVQRQRVVVIDGFIASGAAMIAIAVAPETKEYLVFAHCSDEHGHRAMLDYLGVEPLLQLGLRLGEGTGAALSLPLLQSALAFYNDMASFEQANVDDVVSPASSSEG